MPAKRSTRNQEIGLGRVRYNEVICSPSEASLDTRSTRCLIAKRLDSWERKKTVSRLLTQRYSAASRTCGKQAMSVAPKGTDCIAVGNKSVE